MAVDLLLGLQWGDEGKGKIVDVLTKDYDVIARFQGGPNAGHTLIFDGYKHVLHTIPSGIFHKTALNVVGNGVVIDPVIFKKELAPYPTRKEQSIMESRKKDAPYHMYLSWNYHATLTTATKIQHQKLRYLARQISLGNLILQGAAFHQ